MWYLMGSKSKSIQLKSSEIAAKCIILLWKDIYKFLTHPSQMMFQFFDVMVQKSLKRKYKFEHEVKKLLF